MKKLPAITLLLALASLTSGCIVHAPGPQRGRAATCNHHRQCRVVRPQVTRTPVVVRTGASVSVAVNP